MMPLLDLDGYKCAYMGRWCLWSPCGALVIWKNDGSLE